MNRDELIKEIAERANFTQKDITLVLDTLVEIMTECVAKGDVLKVRGFGKLYSSPVPERRGHNAHTGETVLFPPSQKILFKLAENIKGNSQTKNDL